jgi:multicomponent Na+:H+ antiporter subunit F
MREVQDVVLTVSAVALAVLMVAALVRAVLGPRFTDRVVAVNMINTMAVAIIAILSVRLGEDFLVDVALVYALLSFLTVVLLSRLVQAGRREKGGDDV